jgi:hypothetical protein
MAAMPSVALAQNGFPDYRQAAADQYPQQPPPGNSNGQGQGQGTGGSSGNPKPVHNPGGQGHHHRTTSPSSKKSAGNGAVLGTSGTAAPVAVPTRPVPAAKGSLPFTGSDLSGLVILALALIAAGLFAGAAARATRRRRRATA